MRSNFSDLAIDPDGWAPFLDEGELLLWEGQPSTRIRFQPTLKNIVLTVCGTAFTSIALAGLYASVLAGEFVGTLFGLLFLLAGLFLLVGRHWWDSYRRSKIRYALTDRRALVARSYFERTIESYIIKPDASIELIQGTEDTVLFDAELRHDPRGRPFMQRRGFEMIPDGARVANLLYRIQNALPKRATPVPDPQ